MTDTPIPFPIRGINENWAFGVQPDGTTEQAKNVRIPDPKTGRSRGGQREGLGRQFPNQVAAGNPVLRINHLTFDKKKFTYEALRGDSDTAPAVGDVEEIWSKFTSTDKDALNAGTDSAGNQYVLSGLTIQKCNTDGSILWTVQIPVDNDTFTLGPLVVQDTGDVFVGVNSGSDQTDAAIYRIKQNPVADSFTTEPEIVWEWTVDRFVRELVLHNGTLKALHQDDTAQKAYVVTMVNINLSVPAESSEVEVPYPATCLVVKEDGSYVTGHPPFDDRDSNPLYPGTTLPLEAWTLDDLVDTKKRTWSWFRAEDLVTTLSDGEPIPVWADRSGNGRNQIPGVPRNGSVVIPSPTLDTNGSLPQPTVRYNGTQGLFSLKGGGTDAQRDACKTAIPNHGDAAWCTFVVCRPASQKTEDETDEEGGLIDKRRFLFQQYHHTKYQGAFITSFDIDNTGAHVSGLIVNSSTATAATDDNLYTWGKSKSKRGLHSAGDARPYTSSSGYQFFGTHDADGFDPGAWTAGVSTFDWPGMPLLRGAGSFGWPKEGQFDDSTAEEPGEGLTVFTFMHCGGLDEALEVLGTTGGASTTFTATDTAAFDRYPNGATTGTWTLYDVTGTIMDTVTDINTSTGVLTLASPQTEATKAFLVPPRNMMTRSCWRINGEPIDRWEALPLAYAGADVGTGATAADRALNKNIEQQQTGIGLPEIHDEISGFLGEIAEIVTIGRRQTNEDQVTLGGAKHHLYPTVLDHPMYAINAHVNDVPADIGYLDVGSNLNSREMEKIEGWLMHRYGIAKRLQDFAATFSHPHFYPAQLTRTYDLPLASALDDTGQAWVGRKRLPAALIMKTDQANVQVWCLVSDTGTIALGDIVTLDINDVAFNTGTVEATAGLALDSNGDIYWAGPGSGTDGTFAFGKITDSEDLPLVSKGFYDSVGGAQPDHEVLFPEDVTIRPQVDAFDNFLVPIVPGSTHSSVDPVEAVRIYEPDGTYVSNVSTLEHGSADYQNCWAIVLPIEDPNYDALDFILAPNVQRPEFLYLALERDDNDSGSAEAYAKWRIVSSTPTGDSGARSTDFVAVSGGDIYFDASGVWTKATTNATKFSTTATYIGSTIHEGRLFFTDGANYRIYDPKDKSVVKWESSGSGVLPENNFLITTYRDRVVLARGGQNWSMSASGDPTNWDFFPPTITTDQAVAGTNAPAGLCPDIINALIPYADDYLMFGGDHSIWRLTGDPMKAGEFDLVSDTIGIAFGDAWAKDSQGVLYFFATTGGVYRMSVGGGPQSISDAVDGQDVSIQRRLQTIDLSTHRMVLAWDEQRRGLRVVQVPYSVTAVDILKAWFWDQKNNAWLEDEPDDDSIQPYAMTVFDGDDPDDRVVVFGGKDSFIRFADDNAVNDDGFAIDSKVTIGPIAAGDDNEVSLDRLRAVLANDQGGCSWQIHVSKTPDVMGPIVAKGRFGPGLSQRMPVFQRGAYIWVVLRNALASERWSLEQLLGDFEEMDVRVSF